MFDAAIQSIARDRASMMRDMEYIRNNIEDAPIQESFLMYEACGDSGLFTEEDLISPEEDKDLTETIEQMPVDSKEADEEVERILASENKSISIDEIMGIHDDVAEESFQEFVEEISEYAGKLVEEDA